jgi:hypothetical protein
MTSRVWSFVGIEVNTWLGVIFRTPISRCIASLGGWRTLPSLVSIDILSGLNNTTPVSHPRDTRFCIFRTLCAFGWPTLPLLEGRGFDSSCFPWLTESLKAKSQTGRENQTHRPPKPARNRPPGSSNPGRRLRHPPSGRGDPAMLRQHKLNRHMVFAEGSPNLMQRLPRLPAPPHVGSLLLRKSEAPPKCHYHHHIEK